MNLLALFLLGTAAHAGPFTHRTSQGPWVQRQVAREYALPKGWLQIELAADSKLSTAVRDGQGRLVAAEEGTAWHYSRLWLNVDQGFTRRARIYAHIPVVRARLVSAAGADTATTALGDVHTGVWYQPWLEKRGALAFQVDLKAPSGVEWPSDFIGGAANTEGFLTGTGITNLGAFAHGRVRLGEVLALKGDLGWVHKFPAVVGYVLEDGGFGNGWLNPGDELRAGATAEVQLGDAWCLGADGRFSHRGVYAVGVSGEGAARLDLNPIPGSAGYFVDARLGLTFSPVDNFEAGAGFGMQLMGSDTRLFQALGLEEFSPQPGPTLELSAVVRW
ncbi:MAG: hypothetical protein ABIO70_14490 [Pseudomonadota bacterium]